MDSMVEEAISTQEEVLEATAKEAVSLASQLQSQSDTVAVDQHHLPPGPPPHNSSAPSEIGKSPEVQDSGPTYGSVAASQSHLSPPPPPQSSSTSSKFRNSPETQGSGLTDTFEAAKAEVAPTTPTASITGEKRKYDDVADNGWASPKPTKRQTVLAPPMNDPKINMNQEGFRQPTQTWPEEQRQEGNIARETGDKEPRVLRDEGENGEAQLGARQRGSRGRASKTHAMGSNTERTMQRHQLWQDLHSPTPLRAFRFDGERVAERHGVSTAHRSYQQAVPTKSDNIHEYYTPIDPGNSMHLTDRSYFCCDFGRALYRFHHYPIHTGRNANNHNHYSSNTVATGDDYGHSHDHGGETQNQAQAQAQMQAQTQTQAANPPACENDGHGGSSFWDVVLKRE